MEQQKPKKQSETLSLNMRKLNSIKPGPEFTYFDTDVTGLYVRVRPRSVAYYIRARDPNRKEKVIRLWDVGAKIAPLPDAPENQTEIEIVRDYARQYINAIKRNPKADPREEIEAVRLGGKVIKAKPGDGQGWTLRQLLEEFVATKKDRRRGYLEYTSALLNLPELWVPPADNPKAEAPELPHLDAEQRGRLLALPLSAATEITREDIQLVRDSVKDRVSARRSKAVLDYISGAYKWAHGEPISGIPEGCNPTLGISRGLTKRQIAQAAAKAPPKRKRWLTMDEVQHLILAIDATKADASVRNALILDLLTAQRKGCLITARVDDVVLGHPEYGDHLHLLNTKTGLPQQVPLAPIALAFVRQQMEMARRRNSPWLFPSKHTGITGKEISGHLSDNAINSYIERMLEPPPPLERPTERGRGILRFDTDEEWAAYVAQHEERYGYLHRIGIKPFSPHDFRRTITANLTSRRLCREWYVSVLLDHEVKVNGDERRSEVTGTFYNPYDYWNEKREAAEKWAALVEQAGLSEALFPLPKKDDPDTIRAKAMKEARRRPKKAKAVA